MRPRPAGQADKHEAAFTTGGLRPFRQVQTKTGAEADGLFAQAGEKYAAAVRIKPDMHEAFPNWGNALSAQCRRRRMRKRKWDGLFAQAGEKYAAAVCGKRNRNVSATVAESFRGNQKRGL